MAKAKEKAAAVIGTPDKFCCYYGTQPFFSSVDESLCQAIVERRKAELVHLGVDISDAEHVVEVRPL